MSEEKEYDFYLDPVPAKLRHNYTHRHFTVNPITQIVPIPTSINPKLYKFIKFVFLERHDVIEHGHYLWSCDLSPTTFLKLLPYAVSEVIREALQIPTVSELPLTESRRFVNFAKYKDHAPHIDAIFQDYLKFLLRQ